MYPVREVFPLGTGFELNCCLFDLWKGTNNNKETKQNFINKKTPKKKDGVKLEFRWKKTGDYLEFACSSSARMLWEALMFSMNSIFRISIHPILFFYPCSYVRIWSGCPFEES